MNRRPARILVAATAALLLATAALAQDKGKQPPQMTPEQQAEMEAYMKAATPGAPHKAMAASAGSYTIAVKSWAEPGAPPMLDSGSATRSMAMEGRVMIEQVNSTMMGMPFTGQGTMGYDNVTGKYWHVWMDTMGTGAMFSEGNCDAEMKSCTFTGSYNDPIKKGPVKTRMVSRWTSPTTEVFEMYGPEKKTGKEYKMMEITYSKK